MFRSDSRPGGAHTAGLRLSRRRSGAVAAAILMVLALGFTTIGAPAAAAQPASTPEERAAAITRPAVVYLEIEWEGWVRDKRDGQLWDNESVYFVNRCTGFVVNEAGFIVTAGHCVDPGIEGAAPIFYEEIVRRYVEAGVIDESQSEAALSEISENSEVEGLAAGDPPTRNVYVQRGVAVSGLTTGEAFPARVMDVTPVSGGDTALLKVDQDSMPAIALAEGEVPVGTEILAIGYPGSADDISDQTLEPSSKDGTISNLRTDNGIPVYETSAAMTGGMSGGPVVNMEGEGIGLVSRGPAEEPQAFNFAAPSSLILEMLARNGVTNQLSDIDTQYREGLDNYYDGQYSDAIENFDAVLAQSPAHQQAQEFRQQAVELRQTEGDQGSDDGGMSGWWIAAIVAGALILLVIAAVLVALFLMMRARRRRATPPAGYPAPGAPTPPGPPAAGAAAGAEAPTIPGTYAQSVPPAGTEAPTAPGSYGQGPYGQGPYGQGVPPGGAEAPTAPVAYAREAPPVAPAPGPPPVREEESTPVSGPPPSTAEEPVQPAPAAPAGAGGTAFNGANTPAGSPARPAESAEAAANPDDGVHVATASVMFCGNCGARVSAVERFCTRCGAPVGRGDQSQTG
jgi:serine protease Do